MTDRVIKALPNMAKLFFAIICMVLSMAFFLASINAAMAAPKPMQNITVTGDNITLGDVFMGIEANADYILAPAPKPNTTLTWDGRTINRIAKAFKLSWNAQPTDQIQIRRLASIVTQDMVKDALKIALMDKGLTGAYDLDFIGAAPEIILPHEIEPTVTIEAASYNASRRTFSATLRTPDQQLQQVTGMAYPLVDLPVLKTPSRRGEFITVNMVTTASIRKDSITDDMIITKDDLVGMSPRRVITANTPIMISELTKPVMVKRGDLVTMQLHSGSIKITALAKALETGTKGDIIRVMNVDSKRSLVAKVTGIREASILN